MYLNHYIIMMILFRLLETKCKLVINLRKKDYSYLKKNKNLEVTVSQLNLKKHDLILLRIENRKKLDPFYKGPFEIIKAQYPNVEIQEVGKRKHKTVHSNGLKPYVSSVSEKKDNFERR